jgi:predicted Zn-dependent protease
MKHVAFALALTLAATPAYAQFSKLKQKIQKADDAVKKAEDAKKKADSLSVSEKEERQIGEEVSARVCEEFGVVQDKDVTKYVTLVGSVLTQASERPDLKWEFIVLDTDGVNAFASPGGLVHITKGALGMIKSEAELAGVLAHEIAHVTRKHTVNAIKKNAMVELGADITPGSNAYISAFANAAYDNIVEKGFDRGDEEDADQQGIRLANKAGYNPAGLGKFLAKLADRNKGEPERNGLFASHPETAARIDRLNKLIKTEKLNATAMAEARYASNITYEAVPLASIATVVEGSKGVAGEEPKEKKKGFGLGSLKLSSGKQAESTQASASAGNRAVGRDRAAKGGPIKTKVAIALAPAEVAEFKKGIA